MSLYTAMYGFYLEDVGLLVTARDIPLRLLPAPTQSRTLQEIDRKHSQIAADAFRRPTGLRSNDCSTSRALTICSIPNHTIRPLFAVIPATHKVFFTTPYTDSLDQSTFPAYLPILSSERSAVSQARWHSRMIYFVCLLRSTSRETK